MDVFDAEKRSAVMRAITSKNTKPEAAVRSIVRSSGIKFRANDKRLAGKPDLVFPKEKKVIFVHGCFWHAHQSKRCKEYRPPKSNHKYWGPKILANIARDKRHARTLKKGGWKILVIWECQLKSEQKVRTRIQTFFDADK